MPTTFGKVRFGSVKVMVVEPPLEMDDDWTNTAVPTDGLKTTVYGASFDYVVMRERETD